MSASEGPFFVALHFTTTDGGRWLQAVIFDITIHGPIDGRFPAGDGGSGISARKTYDDDDVLGSRKIEKPTAKIDC